MILRQYYGDTLKQSTDLKFCLPITRLQIAALLGARPESVTRAIKDLEHDGIILFQGKDVSIPDLDQIMELINMDSVLKSLR